MNQDLFEKWLDDQADGGRQFAQEMFIEDVTQCLLLEMERADVSRASLADSLDKSRAYITQVLSGSRNMTLRTCADIAWALSLAPRISFKRKEIVEVEVQHEEECTESLRDIPWSNANDVLQSDMTGVVSRLRMFDHYDSDAGSCAVPKAEAA